MLPRLNHQTCRKILRSNLEESAHTYFSLLTLNSCSRVPAVENISVDQQPLMETIRCDTLGCDQHSHSVTHRAATNKTMYLGSPKGGCGLDKVDQSAPVTLHFQESCRIRSTSPPSFHRSFSITRGGCFWLYQKLRSCCLIAFFSVMQTRCCKLETPEKKTQASDHVAATRRELVRRGWRKEGWTVKDRRWKKEGQDEWRQKYKVTVRQRGWGDF